MLIPIDEIRSAAERIAPALDRTPLLHARQLGERGGVELYLKCENLQKTGSFKPRGALNLVSRLEPARRALGLITVSAGNHAQAVAWAAARFQVPATVVMPSDAPRAKQEAVRGYGASILLHPDRATLFDRLREEERRTGATFVHPFDDPVGLAGAGTLGLEIVEQLPEVDCLVMPIGGGGLMAGVASAVKALKPKCRLIGVEPAEAPGMLPALEHGAPLPVKRPALLADGLGAPFVGDRPFAVARAALDQIVLVSEEEIQEAMRLLLTRAKVVAEGAGAAATAAVLTRRDALPPGSRVVSVISGGNVDPERLVSLFAVDRSAGRNDA